MFDMGLLRINLSKAYGGLGLDTLSYIIAVEELARVDGSQAATVAAPQLPGDCAHCKLWNRGAKREIFTQIDIREKIMGLWTHRGQCRI